MKENVVFFGLMAFIIGLIYLGFDFSLILFVITVVSGFIWAVDHWVFAKKRQAAAAAIGIEASLPELVAQAKSFFPILLAIFVLRSFLFEPFRIPSGSMKPTLLEGDFILVNKFSYGIRLPILNRKIIETSDVARGDVVVFRYPVDPRQDFIKRVIGLPGDVIAYTDDKQLFIRPACHETDRALCPAVIQVNRDLVAAAGFNDNGLLGDVYNEQLGDKTHATLIHREARNADYDYYRQMYGRAGGQRVPGAFQWTVPEGQYLMMGDNRDRSSDGRFWGFVPDDHLKGKAVAVWMHLDFELDGPWLSKIPTGIGFNRIGGIE